MAVTGAGGFVGRHLVAELTRRGVEAVPVRRSLAQDTDWSGALSGCDAVVHLAAAAHEAAERYARGDDYESLRSLNALATERLAREARAAGVGRFIFVSTIGVHGDDTHGVPITERSAFAPRSLYARSKLEAEERLVEVARATGLVLTILRPPLVYGPGNPGNMRRLLRLLYRGWPLPLASVENRRSLVYVGNLADAIACCIASPRAEGRTYLVSDGAPVSTPELCRALARALGRPARLFPVPAAVLEIMPPVRKLTRSLEVDDRAIRSELGWVPPFTFAEGIRLTAQWYLARR